MKFARSYHWFTRRVLAPRSATLLLLCLFTSIQPALTFAAEKAPKKGETRPVTDTLVKVTTFTEAGATLRGASVKLRPADKDGNAIKGKTLEGVTNSMGEYPFHVPKTEARYVLQAEAHGFQPTVKAVHVQGEDQLDIFLQLPARK